MICQLEGFLEHQTELNKADQKGITNREHYEFVERQTGKRPKELDGPEFPSVMSHIWSVFLDLSSTRPQGFNGPLPIPYNEIKSYSELTGVDLGPKDVEIIKRLDLKYLRTIADG